MKCSITSVVGPVISIPSHCYYMYVIGTLRRLLSVFNFVDHANLKFNIRAIGHENALITTAKNIA